MGGVREEKSNKFDILISGGGPFALASALELLKKGKSVAIVSDRDIELKTDDPREKEMAFSRGQRIFLDAENRHHLLSLFPSRNYQELSPQDQKFYDLLHNDTAIKVRHIERFLLRRILEERDKNNQTVKIFNRKQLESVDMESGKATLENSGKEQKEQKEQQEQKEQKEQKVETQLEFTHVIGADGVKRHCVKKVNEGLMSRNREPVFTYKKIVGPKYFHHASIAVNITPKNGKELKIPQQFIETSTKVNKKRYLSGISLNRKKSNTNVIKCVFGGAIPSKLYSKIKTLQELRDLQTLTPEQQAYYEDLKAHLKHVLAPLLGEGVSIDDFDIDLRRSTKPTNESQIATQYQQSKDKLSLQRFGMYGLKKANTASYFENGRTASIGSDSFRDPNYQFGHGLNDGLKHARYLAAMLSGEVSQQACELYSRQVDELSTKVERINRAVNLGNRFYKYGDKQLVEKGNARVKEIHKSFVEESMSSSEFVTLKKLTQTILESLAHISKNPTQEEIDIFGFRLEILNRCLVRQLGKHAGQDELIPLYIHFLSQIISPRQIGEYKKVVDQVALKVPSFESNFFRGSSQFSVINFCAAINHLHSAENKSDPAEQKRNSEVISNLKRISHNYKEDIDLRLPALIDDDIQAKKLGSYLNDILEAKDTTSAAKAYAQFGLVIENILTTSHSTLEQFKKYLASVLSGIELQVIFNDNFRFNYDVVKEANLQSSSLTKNINLGLQCIHMLMKQNGVHQKIPRPKSDQFRTQVGMVQSSFETIANEINQLPEEKLLPKEPQSTVLQLRGKPGSELAAQNPHIKPPFLTRHPRVRDALKGAIVGLFVVGVVAIVATLSASTFGLAPVLAGGALAIGSAFPVGITAAYGIGFTTIALSIIAGFSMFSTVAGGLKKFFSKNPVIVQPQKQPKEKSSKTNSTKMQRVLGTRRTRTLSQEPPLVLPADSNTPPKSVESAVEPNEQPAPSPLERKKTMLLP